MKLAECIPDLHYHTLNLKPYVSYALSFICVTLSLQRVSALGDQFIEVCLYAFQILYFSNGE